MGTMNPTEATAQESADSRYIEEIVTLGTRTAGRTVTDSAVPVGVFAQDELESVGTASDLTNVIAKLVPSFNWRGYDANGSFFYRRAGIRQLLPVHLADGSIYDPRDRFPGGFTPRFFGHVVDSGLTGGIRGATDNDLNWDSSICNGENEIEYILENTWNPSLGSASAHGLSSGRSGRGRVVARRQLER